MPYEILQGEHTNPKVFCPLTEVESEALTQVRNLATLPTIHAVAVMPDVHAGKGCTVGSVVATKGSVSPATVGVDIGCGMAAVPMKTDISMRSSDMLAALRHAIEDSVPVGFNGNIKSPRVDIEMGRLGRRAMQRYNDLNDGFSALHKDVQDLTHKALDGQMGTLGGGNHFIEVCLDEAGNPWLMLHSGSRNIGKSLAEIHIKIAQALQHNKSLPDKDLAYLLQGTPELRSYRHDLYWAQLYAACNRDVMMGRVKEVLRAADPNITFGEAIECHHNYVSEEVHFGEEVFVTRKGAIYAGDGARGIIPGSMGTRSYIVTGLGNADSMNSASHGAGRRMSRGKAKKAFTLDDLAQQTAGVECRKDAGVLDEIPGAYKDIDKVMENQRDLVRIDHTLKALLCVKG